jgi:hypothetical protein
MFPVLKATAQITIFSHIRLEGQSWHTRSDKSMMKICGILVLCLILATVASAQTNTSPQGGAAIYTGAAVCTSAAFPSSFVSLTGTLPPPCLTSKGDGEWFTVMTAYLKASQTEDFFISPSLVTGLYTNTQVKGNTTTATSQTASASGVVSVRVLLDCSNCAAAGNSQGTMTAVYRAAGQPDPDGNGVVFDARIQQLTATLGQAITSSCLSLITLATTCPVEQIDLILSTASAHTFNFILLNVGATGTASQGNGHSVTVQAKLDVGQVCTSGLNGSGPVVCDNSVNTAGTQSSSIAAALFGLGSLTVVPVHLSPDFSF